MPAFDARRKLGCAPARRSGGLAPRHRRCAAQRNSGLGTLRQLARRSWSDGWCDIALAARDPFALLQSAIGRHVAAEALFFDSKTASVTDRPMSTVLAITGASEAATTPAEVIVTGSLDQQRSALKAAGRYLDLASKGMVVIGLSLIAIRAWRKISSWMVRTAASLCRFSSAVSAAARGMRPHVLKRGHSFACAEFPTRARRGAKADHQARADAGAGRQKCAVTR